MSYIQGKSRIARAHTLSLICFAVSVKNIDEFVSEALILDLAPCRAGKNDECTSAGLGKLSLGAASRVIRKYGSFKRRESQFRSASASTDRATCLVYCTRYEARHVFAIIENKWKRRAEARRRLNGRKANLADAVAVSEAEDTLDLIVGHGLLDATDVFVKVRTLP
jgi:hypothetical protein